MSRELADSLGFTGNRATHYIPLYADILGGPWLIQVGERWASACKHSKTMTLSVTRGHLLPSPSRESGSSPTATPRSVSVSIPRCRLLDEIGRKRSSGASGSISFCSDRTVSRNAAGRELCRNPKPIFFDARRIFLRFSRSVVSAARTPSVVSSRGRP
jgi:hypothetical protein